MILLTLSRGKGEETVRLQLPASPAEIGETFAFLDRISLDTTATAILDVSSNVRSSGHWMISAGLVCCKRTHAGGRMGVLLPICIMWYDGGVQCWLRSIYWIIWLIKWDAEFFLIFGCSSKVNGCTGSLPRSL